MPYKDPEVQKLYDKLKYQRNRGKRLEQVREYALKNRDKYLEYHREYGKQNREAMRKNLRRWRAKRTPETIAREKAWAKEYWKNNRDKAIQRYQRYKVKNKPQYMAHTMMRAAINCGYIVKPKRCQHCGTSGRIHGHHVDYSKIFEVEWLCHACHLKAHNGSFHNPPIRLLSARPQAGT